MPGERGPLAAHLHEFHQAQKAPLGTAAILGHTEPYEGIAITQVRPPRHKDHPAGSIAKPRTWDLPYPGRGDDPVVRRSHLLAVLAVPCQNPPEQLSGRQTVTSRIGHTRVDLDADDILHSEPMGQERRVPTGPGPDLQDAVPRLDLKRRQHAKDDRRHGRRRRGHAAAALAHTVVPLGDDRHVRVGVRRPEVRLITPVHGDGGAGVHVERPDHVRQERRPGHGGERRKPVG